jgi:Xaa-Pro aminopeptidase
MTEFSKRREALFAQMANNSMMLLPAATEALRNGDGYYPFRQHSDFYYLTGFQEPDAVMVLHKYQGNEVFILYNRPRDPKMETWNGRRAGQIGAVREWGADESYSIEDFLEHLPELLQEAETLYYPIGADAEFDAALMTALNEVRANVRRGASIPTLFMDVNPLIHEMRLFKSDEEIALMRRAAQISVEAHRRAMQVCRPGMKEYQLQAEIEYVFKNNGSGAPAYNSIVGSGSNTCILHYNENDQTLAAGALVLIDAGCEFENYASDITTTFPVNGLFTKEQRQIYELVLNAQATVINLIKPGLPWDKMQELTIEVLVDGLLSLGILKGTREQALAKKTYEQFYMHRVGHWLGLDTHDVGSYRHGEQWRLLEAGMVFTVEPGLYIPANTPDVDPCWWDIGVRIEDDVLVTTTGCDILTAGLPRTVEEIEAFMAAF